MTVHYKTRGLVFKKEDRQDADRIFSVFTRDFGRVEIFAKAIRKINSKLKGGIDIFFLSELEFIQGKNRKTLTDAVSIEKFKHIAQSPEKTETAGRVCGLLDDFIKGPQTDGGIWDLAEEIFTKLNRCAPAGNTFLYYYFFWNFAALLGYKPELSKCASCGRILHPQHLYFSSKEGGVLCQGCGLEDSFAKKINADAVKVLRLILKKEWGILSKLKISRPSKEIFKTVSDDYYHHLAGTIH